MNNFPAKVTFVFSGHNRSIYMEIAKENGFYLVTYWVVKQNYASVLQLILFPPKFEDLEEVQKRLDLLLQLYGRRKLEPPLQMEKEMTVSMLRFRASQEQTNEQTKNSVTHLAPYVSHFWYQDISPFLMFNCSLLILPEISSSFLQSSSHQTSPPSAPSFCNHLQTPRSLFFLEKDGVP